MHNKPRRILVPALLDRVAAAETLGVELSDDPCQAAEIELCREWGYSIIFENGRARIAKDPDVLIPSWIVSETPAILWEKLRVVGYLDVGSTNDEALKLVRQGTPGGTLVYAERQTAGRGRNSRQWHSPRGAGLYFSLVIYPGPPTNYWPVLTHGAAVALVDTLQEYAENAGDCGKLGLDIKWPNDVLLSNKKVAGILLETCQAGPTRQAAVVGIGVNISQASVPSFLRHQATCVDFEAGVPVPRRRLLVRMLYHLQLMLDLFEKSRFEELLEMWKQRSSMWTGIPVWVVEGSRSRSAVTCGLTEIGALRIRTGNGAEETLLAGDIRIRRVSASEPTR